MILGTYLIMPILNKWLLNADLKEAEYFLVIWAVTCIFWYTFHINLPINLNYFTGAIGAVVLGYYLRHTKRKMFNKVSYSIIFIINMQEYHNFCKLWMNCTIGYTIFFN